MGWSLIHRLMYCCSTWMERERVMFVAHRLRCSASETSRDLRARLSTAAVARSTRWKPRLASGQDNIRAPLPTCTEVDTSNIALIMFSLLPRMVAQIRSGFARASHSHLMWSAYPKVVRSRTPSLPSSTGHVY
jgi:hypothetical protein